MQATLSCEQLRRDFGATRALDGLDLAVQPGEIYGLVGPDGAGKTTAMRIFAGLIAPSGGRALVLGHEPLRQRRHVRTAIGYMPQQYSLYGDLSVAENLDFFARMFCLRGEQLDRRRERLLGITRLSRFVDRRASALSGGMYKKLSLACALLPSPELLLLDEPTNGVDPVSRRELWQMLFELVGDGGDGADGAGGSGARMSVVVTTPYMDEAARCHRVGLIDRGRLLLEGEPGALLRRFEHPTYEILDVDIAHADELAANEPGVLAASVTGERVRVVVQRERDEAVRTALAQLGATLQPSKPTFEDLFLATTALEHAREAAAA